MHDAVPDFIPGNILSLDLKALGCEFETLHASGIGSSRYDHIVSLNEGSVMGIPLLNELLKSIYNTFPIRERGYEFNKLWLVNSEPNNYNPDKLPFVPHIDYSRYFKLMIYLDEVGADDGPFHYLPSNPESYEAHRQSLEPDYKASQKNVIDDQDLSSFIACCGPAGSVAVFDTNCPHFAGAVKKLGKRRVIRLDFSHPAWNARNRGFGLLTRLVSRLKGQVH